MFTLFEDQTKAVNEAVNNLKLGKNVLLYSPTASGKTVMGSDIVFKMGLKTLFLVNKKTLVSQSYDKLFQHGLNVAVYHNTITKNIDGEVMNSDITNADVIVSLIETYENGELDFEPEFIVLDECHKSTSEGYQNFRDKYPNALILGLTATPGRLKNKTGESLSDWYDVMVIGDTVENLLKKGRLAKPEYKIFDETSHEVDVWKQLTCLDDNRRTIIFARNASHMVALRKAFRDNGVSAEYISSGSELEDIKDEIEVQTDNQRNQIFKKFRDGEIEVLISFGVLCEGFDEPLTKYLFILRKVSHISILHQMIGRVMRIHPTKNDCFICDFYGNIEEFGRIENYVWEMDGGGYKQEATVKDGSTIYMGHFKRKPIIFVVCSECHHSYDVAKHDSCVCCSRRNVVKISATFAQMRDFFVEKIDSVAWNKFCSSKFVKKGDEFWTFFEIIEKALKTNQTHVFNRMYCEIFENGTFTREYSWMSTLLSNKRKLKYDSRIDFVL